MPSTMVKLRNSKAGRRASPETGGRLRAFSSNSRTSWSFCEWAYGRLTVSSLSVNSYGEPACNGPPWESVPASSIGTR